MATARLNRPTISNRISSIKRAITRAKLSLSYFISPFFHFSLFLFPSIESGLVVFTPSGIVFTRVQWCTCVRIFMKNIWKFRIVPAEQADGKGESAEADREQKPLWDRKSARVDSYHPLEVVRERRPDGSHGSITSRAPTFFHSHRNGCGGLSRGGGSAPKTRKYSFNGDDRLSPQLKLIFFFFFSFTSTMFRSRGWPRSIVSNTGREEPMEKSKSLFFFFRIRSILPSCVPSIRELGDGGFEKKRKRMENLCENVGTRDWSIDRSLVA